MILLHRGRRLVLWERFSQRLIGLALFSLMLGLWEVLTPLLTLALLAGLPWLTQLLLVSYLIPTCCGLSALLPTVLGGVRGFRHT